MKEFNKDILKIDDVEKLVDQICSRIKSDVMGRYSRRGGVIGISGGIDSSACVHFYLEQNFSIKCPGRC